MGIQLDWQIESEQQQRRATEDPNAQYTRRRKRRRLLFVVLGLALIVCAVVGGILWRLHSYEDRLRQDLLATVDAEVRSLKIGDEDNYLAIRRSGSDYWMDLQRQLFTEYQQLKNTGHIELTGKVINVEMDIDESRARVLVEEKIDGYPYQVAWFYWYYTDENQSGWRRVPPDVAFWGNRQTLTSGTIKVNYYELDNDLAQALIAHIESWWSNGCQWLGCSAGMPALEIEIEPRSPAAPSWDLNNEWKLLLTSPLYTNRVRLGNQLSPELENVLANMLATRLLDYNLVFKPSPYADSEWVYEELQRWLVGRFIEDLRTSDFLETLIEISGTDAPNLIIQSLAQSPDIGTLLLTTGIDLPSLGIDVLNTMGWQNFFEWRLLSEQRILNRDQVPEGQEIFYQYRLYDEQDNNALRAADIIRETFIGGLVPFSITGINYWIDGIGSLIANVDVVHGTGGQTAVFRWTKTTWKRVS